MSSLGGSNVPQREKIRLNKKQRKWRVQTKAVNFLNKNKIVLIYFNCKVIIVSGGFIIIIILQWVLFNKWFISCFASLY